MFALWTFIFLIKHRKEKKQKKPNSGPSDSFDNFYKKIEDFLKKTFETKITGGKDFLWNIALVYKIK